jgi:hypothetical protein
VGSAQELAQRPARDPVGFERRVLEPFDRVEIAGTRLAYDNAAMAPIARGGNDLLPPLAPPAAFSIPAQPA